ncbi:synergin gamma isoform X1 [Nasonia vitripennis]|uniref:EH domain-containing protein n=1 Tax=Nasonia vitripennis TaxID=7425 RepID=A0A7M7GC04_NASVI|nr:synergin gamma isoform X1 [Nasonia vitripennis]
MSKAYVNSDKRMSQLPGWLWPNSNVLSPLYKRIWEAVQEDRPKPGAVHNEVLVDTNKIFPLLLTSQLPTEVLGYIWSLANQKYAGQLTEQELYVVLALVALAQASYPFNSLEVLYYIRIPPTPNLNLSLLDANTVKNETKVHVSPFDSPSLNSVTNKKHGNSTRPSSKSMNLPSNADGLTYNHNHSDSREVKFSSGHSSSYNANTVYVDGRQNFYSQPEVKHQSSSYSATSTDSNDDFSDFQSAPITNVPTIPNIWDSKQGSAIGSRLANHNLGVKKLNDKVKKTGTSKSSNNNQARNITVSNPLSNGREIQSNELLTDLFPKCNLKNQSKTFILKDTAIRNNDSVEVVKPAPKDLQLPSHAEKIVKINPLPKPTYSKNIDSVYVAPLKESKDDGLQQDLMSLQPTTEDKYSALRALVEEPPVVSVPKPVVEPMSVSPPVDDFGDFVSAEQPEPVPTVTVENSSALNSIDLLSDFDFNTESIIGTNSKSSPSLIQEISDAFNALAFEENTDRPIEEKFDVVFDTAEKVVQREDALSINSIELGPPPSGVLTRSGSVPSLDLKSFLPSSQDDEQQIENMHQMIYWEWKQYMESCVLLLQVAANIFTSITSEIVLREVLSSAQGYNFLCNLAEVAAVCRRVNFSHKEMDINIMGFDDLLMDIDKIWSEMEPFYTNIPIVTELPAWPLHHGDGLTCALCLTIITSGRITYNDNNYHATCANLWLHTVNSNLPALRYPIPYIQSIPIPQSANHT